MHTTALATKQQQPATIAIVEDDPLVCQGMRDTLEAHGWAVDAYVSGEEFLAASEPARADCLLLDANLPGMRGLDVLAQMRRDGRFIPAIVITGSSDIKTAVAAMKAGAVDFIEKPVLGPELIRAVTRGLDQAGDLGKADMARSSAAARIAVLTKRQHQIMTLVLAGRPNKNIASDLGISQRTVENHRARIMARTGSASLPELARLALTAIWSVETNAAPEKAEGAMPSLPSMLPSGRLDDDQFRRFFDAVPMAIVIGSMATPEVIVYANAAFEKISGQTLTEIEGKPWSSLRGNDPRAPDRVLGEAVMEASDWVGAFASASAEGASVTVDAYANVIVDDDDQPAFRLLALVTSGAEITTDRIELEGKIRERDAMILEIQHRVKNNLQMITSLIRIEARNNDNNTIKIPLGRLEGRVNSIQILCRLLSEFSNSDEIDIGVYLSEIASAVMHAHAVEGIRLDLKVDSYPVSVNVALPTGLVANELLTNALKHAFVGLDGGTITLHSLSDATGCRITIADDGVGLPEGVEWPRTGKMGALIVRSLRQNAKATLKVESAKGGGTKVTIAFSRAAVVPIAENPA